MAFVLPTFNITADIYTHVPGGTVPTVIREVVDCQLRGPEMRTAASSVASEFATSGMVLLVPPGTDLRDTNSTPGLSPDWVVVPSGSDRWYNVIRVDDVAKGFANEHRFAILRKATFLWPVPMP